MDEKQDWIWPSTADFCCCSCPSLVDTVSITQYSLALPTNSTNVQDQEGMMNV